MKNFILLFFYLIANTAAFATDTETITNWQVYKDGRLLFKSNASDNTVHNVFIKKSDDFKVLELLIAHCTVSGKTRRKILFKQDGKTGLHISKAAQSGQGSCAHFHKELHTIIGPDINKKFTLEYTIRPTAPGK